MMAEEMIGVEENVQKRYDEEHSKAREFLKNTKNLGEPRVRKVEPAPESKVESKVESKSESKVESKSGSESSFTSRYGIALLSRQTLSQEAKPVVVKPETSKVEQVEEPKVEKPKIEESSDNFPKFIPGKIIPEHTDVNFGSGSLQDLMMSQINADNHKIKALEDTVPEDIAPQKTTPPSKQSVQELLDEVGEEIKEIEETSPEETQSSDDSDSVEDTQSIIDAPVGLSAFSKDAEPEVVEEEIEEDDVSETEPEKSDNSSNDTSSDSDETSQDETSQDETPQLDSKKLQEMMEEDGPMEEKTREITEKPKNVKPKEDYVENSIDLGNIFNVNK
jgi:hypothetical protein